MTNGNDSASGFVDNRSSSYEDNEVHYGLTKRELFAAMAMQGLLAKEGWAERICSENSGSLIDMISEAATVCADTLIEQLNKKQP